MKKSFEHRLVTYFDWPLLACTLGILGLGVMNLYSSTLDLPIARYLASQAIWASSGVVIMLMVTLVDYRHLERFSYGLYWVVVLVLALVLLLGRSALGAQRWLLLGPISIQPSELAKLGITLCLAHYFHVHRENRLLDFSDLVKPGLLLLLPFVLILKQPDLGTALVVASVGICMILFVGVRVRVLVISAAIFLSAVPLVWKFALHPYQRDRVTTFLSPQKHALGKGYQTVQAKIAIGSGELTGKGYLKGTQSKLQFLPKQHTDFIFSNFAEEFGFLGSVFLLFLYLSLAFLALKVALTAREMFGMMLAVGLTALITSQVVINLGMETGILPVVGITLPLFSYGGTSLLTSLLSIGLLLNISMRRFMF